MLFLFNNLSHLFEPPTKKVYFSAKTGKKVSINLESNKDISRETHAEESKHVS